MSIDEELARLIDEIARKFHSESLDELPLFLEARKINKLFHFTPVQNIKSIFKFGILGIDELQRRGIEFKSSDRSRSDPIPNGICVSLTNANDYMLSRKLSQGFHMALLELKPALEILSNLTFIASPGNFGRQDHKTRILNWPEKYCGGNGISNLFTNEPIREKYGLLSSQPTDPQSELIFLDPIPSKFISKVILPSGRAYASEDEVRRLVLDLPKGTLIQSKNQSEFPQIVWSDKNRVREFEERKWKIEWE
jgi:hypothetical protein